MLYKHFGSKQDLFVAALQHGGLAVKAKVIAAVGDADHPLRGDGRGVEPSCSPTRAGAS